MVVARISLQFWQMTIPEPSHLMVGELNKMPYRNNQREGFSLIASIPSSFLSLKISFDQVSLVLGRPACSLDDWADILPKLGLCGWVVVAVQMSEDFSLTQARTW